VEKPAPAAAPKQAAAPAKQAAPAAAKPEKMKVDKPKKAATPEVKREPYKPVQAPGTPAPVPESLFKKQQRDAALKVAADAHKVRARKAARTSRKAIFKKAEKYAAEYRAQAKNLIRQKRQAKNSNNIYIAPEPKVVFVVRVRGIMRAHPTPTA
jgi:hypothetical protein